MINLKAIRLHIGWGVKYTAGILNVPVETYRHWEKGKTTPHDVTLEGCVTRIRKQIKKQQQDENQTL